VRKKHNENTRVGLWGQLTILKAVWDVNYKWYQSRPLPVRCGSGTNQAEVDGHVTPPLGGHVMPKADEGREWSGSWQLLGKTESHRNERDHELW